LLLGRQTGQLKKLLLKSPFIKIKFGIDSKDLFTHGKLGIVPF